jgi:hypothetical protein
MPDRPLLNLLDGDDVLAALRAVDEGSLYFTPGGLAGPLEPAQAARIFATWMAQLSLADDVPEDIRLNFDRVRKLFLYGLLERDLFSLANHEAHLVLEGALRHRFVSYYNGQLPILRDGVAETIAVSSFYDYYKLRPTLKRCRLGTSAAVGETLPFSYSALYSWARRQRLLVGQRNVGVFASLVNLRNYAAHPERYSDDIPPWVVRLLVDVAEIINKLWGHNTDGGRLFPGPVHRHLRCAALSPDSTAAVTFGSLAGVQTEEKTRDWTFAVFLAADREELIDFDWQSSGGQRFKHEPGFQMTDYPAEQIVAPTSLDDVLSFLSAKNLNEVADTIDFQDRLFFVRHYGAQRPEFPRSLRDMEIVDGQDDSVRWYVVRADFPMDAWVRIRDAVTVEQPPLHSEIIAELTGDDMARTYAQSLASPTS